MVVAFTTSFCIPKPNTTTTTSLSLSLSLPSSSFTDLQPLQLGLCAKFSQLRPKFRLREMPETPQVPTLPEVLLKEVSKLQKLEKSKRSDQYVSLQQTAEIKNDVFFNQKHAVGNRPLKIYVQLEYDRHHDRVILKFGGCTSMAVNSFLISISMSLLKRGVYTLQTSFDRINPCHKRTALPGITDFIKIFVVN